MITLMIAEYLATLLAEIRKQGLSLLLLFGMAGLFWFQWQQESGKLNKKIEHLELALITCNKDREDLAVKLASLEAKLSYTNTKIKRK